MAYVQDKILPKSQKLYTDMPVTPVINSRSAEALQDYILKYRCIGSRSLTLATIGLLNINEDADF